MALRTGPHQNTIGIKSGRPPPLVQPPSDPYFDNVVLLVDFDGADAATSAIDASNSGHILTFEAQAQLDTAQKKFGTASLLLDGSLDSVHASDSDDWNFGSGEFTIEAWGRLSSLGGGASMFISQWLPTGSQKAWLLYYASGTLHFVYTTNGATDIAISIAWSPSINTWYAVAVDRDSSGTLRIYVDGVMLTSGEMGSSVIHNSTTDVVIGDQMPSGGDFPGWIDEVRVTKGVARYASDGGYTVATEQFPRPIDPYWSSVSTLLGLNGADTTTTFIDDSPTPLSYGVAGDSQHDTAQAKFGISSLLTDGVGDWIGTVDHANLELGSDDWTFEGHFRWGTLPSTIQFLAGKWLNSPNHSYGIRVNGVTDVIELMLSSNGTTATVKISETWIPTIDTWHHIAADWDGTTYRVYVDGVVIGNCNWSCNAR